MLAHARRLHSKYGEFVPGFSVSLKYTGMDKDTAGDLERRVVNQMRARGTRVMNSARISGPPQGRMLALLIMHAKAKKAARATPL